MQRLNYLVEYFLCRQLANLSCLLPQSLAVRVGTLLGSLGYVVMAKRRDMAELNMRWALPEKSPEEVEEEVRSMFRHLGVMTMDVLRMKHAHRAKDLSRYFEFEHQENLTQAYAAGKGVLLLTGHLGNWEAGSCIFPRLGYPTAFIAKRMKNRYLDSFVKKNRERGGAEMIDAKRGARRILKALGEKKLVVVLPDQHHKEGIRVNFFDRPARTTTMLVKLAMKTGAPVVPAFTLRTEEGRYRTRFGEPVYFEPSSDPEVIKEYTQQYTGIIEDAVRETPSQWFWLHNRWHYP